MVGAIAPLVQNILYILFILSWWINGLSWFDPALGLARVQPQQPVVRSSQAGARPQA